MSQNALFFSSKEIAREKPAGRDDTNAFLQPLPLFARRPFLEDETMSEGSPRFSLLRFFSALLLLSICRAKKKGNAVL